MSNTVETRLQRTPLTDRGRQLRRDCLVEGRKHGIYHFGGALSAVEILIALYDGLLTEDDRVIVSKGHGWFPQYLILKERGLNPVPYSHPQRDPQNGIFATTGSLGHGLPIGAGMAWAKKLKGEPGRVYVIVGEGCVMEGTFWETIQLVSALNIDNLCILFDWNQIQGAGRPFRYVSAAREMAWEADWSIVEVDGHSVEQISAAAVGTGPLFVRCDTVKGRGVSFMENEDSWHARWPSEEELARALKELS